MYTMYALNVASWNFDDAIRDWRANPKAVEAREWSILEDQLFFEIGQIVGWIE